MKVRYVGPHAAVDLALPDGKWTYGIKRGALTQVDDAHGASLLDQPSNWQLPEKEPEKKPAKAKETD